MRVWVEVSENTEDIEVVIKCAERSAAAEELQKAVDNFLNGRKLVFYKDDTEYFFDANLILFFETTSNGISAHTAKDVYEIKNKLYELEQLLSDNFMRISKSTIINVNRIYSINRNLTSDRSVQFYDSHKQVFVSRSYYKNLKNRLEERRNYNE